VTQYDLRYRFSASGQADVARAFQSISTSAAKAATAEQRGQARTEAAAAKAGAAKERAAAKALAADERAANTSAKLANAAANAEEKAAKRAADAKIREQTRAQSYVAKIRDRHFLAEQRQQERAEQKAQSRRSKLLGSLGNGAMDAGLMLGGAAIGAGGAVVGAAARKEFALRSKTRDISVSTRGSGEVAVSPEVLAREFQKTAIGTPGQTADGIADAVKAFTTKTGDLDMARKLQGTFATLSSASGTDAKDIGASAADLMQKFGIKDVGEMQGALGKLYMQGKAGSFELSDAAAKFPMMAAAGQRFGLDKGAKGVATLGGLSQIARESTGSADQAGTAVEAMFRQLISKSGDLKEKGVNVFDKGGNARDIQDVLVETISKVGGSDMEKKKVGLQKVFGDEGIRAISPLIDTFASAVKDGTDPVKALRDKLRSAIDVTGAWEDVQEDAAMQQQSSSAKATAAWEALSSKVGDQVVPELMKMMDSLSATPGLFDALAGTAGVLASAFVGLIDFLKTIPGVGDMLKGPDKPLDQQYEESAATIDKLNAKKAKTGLNGAEEKQLAEANKKLEETMAAQELGAAAANKEIAPEDFDAIYRSMESGREETGNQKVLREAFNMSTGAQAERVDYSAIDPDAPNAGGVTLETERLQASLDKLDAAVNKSASAVSMLGQGRGDVLGSK
jgi:hypothetical protein